MTSRIFAMVSTKSSKNYTPLAIESFFQYTPLNPGEKLVLIDNDKSLSKSKKNDLVSVVSPTKPRSFAGNFNWILEKAKTDKADIYFLNNDIVFTPDWILPLEPVKDAIVTPVSNREYQYRKDGLRLDVSCKLEDYKENSTELNKIVEYHKRKHSNPNASNLRKVISLPFFCVKVPVNVWNALGPLDDTFGVGGAEDNDYCLRAHLKGISVEYAINSYLLHFSGKSTWDGAESAAETAKRDDIYRSKFKKKWGENLLKLSILGDLSPVIASPEILGLFQQGKFGEVIEKLQAA